MRPLIEYDHRTTERDAPQATRVSLTQLRDFLEPLPRELWLDLCRRSTSNAKQRQQPGSLETDGILIVLSFAVATPRNVNLRGNFS